MTEPSELSGLLNRALSGLHRLFQNEGFTESVTIIESLDDYKKQNDTVAAFINDCCVFDANSEIERGELFAAYQKYCENDGYKEISRIACYNRVRAYTQIGERKESKGRYFTGILVKMQ
jgi:putative DNA primase/helicase